MTYSRLQHPKGLTSQGNRGKFERVARLLIDMKAGIGHLTEKLHVVKLDETTVDPNDEKACAGLCGNSYRSQSVCIEVINMMMESNGTVPITVYMHSILHIWIL